MERKILYLCAIVLIISVTNMVFNFRALAVALCVGTGLALCAAPRGVVASGVPLFDQDNVPVNAHGGSIVRDGDKYYLFGEWKSDTTNAFSGFSCYSSQDLTNWHFEGLALARQADGVLGPGRVGERVKVMKCPATGEYVMYMHADDMRYRDPYTAYATSDKITGPYTVHGPLMYAGKPLKHWDMGVFQDTDGSGYVLIHHGPIYRLTDDYRSVAEKVAHVDGCGESPAVFKKDGRYYHLSSNLTSWERNDNYYYTAPSMRGPWKRQGLFCPEGSLTWNSQTTYVFPLVVDGDTIPMYMGDRWSYPHQASAATYVWQPMSVDGDKLRIPEYYQFWDVATARPVDILAGTRRDHRNLRQPAGPAVGHVLFDSDKPGDKLVYDYTGSKVAIGGQTGPTGGYARVVVTNQKADTVFATTVDFYSLKPSRDIRIITPAMPVARYTLTVEVAGDHSQWSDKRCAKYGSDGNRIVVDDVYVYDIDVAVPSFPDRDFVISSYGAVEGTDTGKAVKANMWAFAAAIKACGEAGGGRVVVPAGRWHTGPIHFRSNVNLYLSEGAEVVFADDPKLYLPAVPTSWEGMECYNYSPLVYAYECENVAITGPGRLAPKMDLWRTWFKRPAPHMEALKNLYTMMSEGVPVEKRQMAKGENHLRPHLVQFNRCKGVLLEDFSIRESPFWTIHLYICENVTARGLDVYAHGHNNDGIDLEMTRNVLVEDCNFDQGDDGVVIKSGRNQDAWRIGRPTENVVVRNCNIANAHCLMGIGSEISGGIRNIYMHHCTVPKSVFRLFFVKTNHRRGAFVNDVYLEDVEADHADTVFEIDTDVLYQWRDLVPTYETRRTVIDGIYLRHARLNSAKMMYRFVGDAEEPIRNVGISDVHVDSLSDEASVAENVVNLDVVGTTWGRMK